MNQFRPAVAACCFLAAVVMLATGSLPAADKKDDREQTNALTAYVGHDNMQHVFYRSSDGSIYELYHRPRGDNAGWHQNNLMTAAKAPRAESSPAACYFKGDGTHHVVYRGADGHIHELYRARDGQWQHANLSAEIKVPAAVGNPTCYLKEDDSTKHILFRTTDGHIRELFRLKDPWKLNNLTAEAKAPPAAGDPTGYILKQDNSQHVVYRGTDGQIHELFSGVKGGWNHDNLTAEAQAPKAAGDPLGCVKPDTNMQHVFYRTEQGDICELYRASGGDKPRWLSNNLTDVAKAPRAAGDPSSYVLKHTKTLHVIYRGTDSQIHELYRAHKGDWMHNSLTTVAKVPLAGSDPIGYTKENDNTQHVVFRTTAGDICELYRAAASDQPTWFGHNLTTATKSP